MGRLSVAMTSEVERELTAHLLRADGQEDLCLASYSPSTGRIRSTSILTTAIYPRAGEREVHHNASFTGEYLLRAASEAARRGEGIAILHSHPRGRGWQVLSRLDHDAESSYARLALAVTGHPLVGLTLAGVDRTWSARAWAVDLHPREVESVRVVGDRLQVHWNAQQRPPTPATASQARTVSAWGEEVQESLTRLRVLVVGVGSVGLDIAARLAATGIHHVGVMDFDIVEEVNLDRMIGATRADAERRAPKVDVALRQMREASTANASEHVAHQMSVCDPEGLGHALDYDVIFSCVDRPWPRTVLNTVAYADLIPVIDGGIAIDTFENGRMRGATWRAHTLVPERPCMACNGQLNLAEVQLDRQGLLDDPLYIQGAGKAAPRGKQNVALLSSGVSAAMQAQFVSLVATPGGRGVPAAQRYLLAAHRLESMDHLATHAHCRFEKWIGEGDARIVLTATAPGLRSA